ncbi:uncharacterized protein [Battus philenor]
MAATPAIVRMHKNGIIHQKLVGEHYQQYKDPATILSEESKKKPCMRFPTGECVFGTICRFSHYTEEQMNALREYVAAKERKNLEPNQPSFTDLYQKLQTEKNIKSQNPKVTTLYDHNGITYTFPWVYNEAFDVYGESLPPSLKKFKIDDFINVSFAEWG